ncbi:hypothetical protein P5D95_16050 [Vibrio parahaemolyticus]|nr:hypothetical protein [Vibrio parahaemolyticus]MDF4484025.1 hypothetical protein [Vibrio parahaemolyticus]MDF4916989.1 hypothetical protein [Vibrio parahaemolyticus]MDF4917150.1 hypothetical protein [Vibrio parahaemolyticus]MDG3368404.1 hypothetical protein [Vibrio parahaemolyticus]
MIKSVCVSIGVACFTP